MVGPDRHIVIYYTQADRSELYFVTSVPEPADWITDGILVGQGRRARNCAPPMRASIPKCARC